MTRAGRLRARRRWVKGSARGGLEVFELQRRGRIFLVVCWPYSLGASFGWLILIVVAV
jgi:hypothetical protein